MTGVLARKLLWDMWRQRAKFAAVVVVVAIGVAVFIGASDAYRNLNDSFDHAYATQRLPDVVLTGPAAPSLTDQAASLPGEPAIEVRSQAELGVRVGDHTLLGRVVSIPATGQPAVARLAVRTGHLPEPSEVLVEEHLADHFRLRPGDTIELLGPDGWRPVVVSGSGLSTEYFWPARSQQETMTSAEQFGVMFAPETLTASLSATRQDQVVLYAQDRSRADDLVAAATALGRTADLVVTTRSDQPSYVALDQDVQAFGEFANLLPVLFLVAAVLGAFILLSRLVHTQRAVIGTLAANGLSARTLRRHYLGYGLVAGVAAVIPGMVGGYALGAWFTTLYTDALGLPLHVTSVHPATLLVGAGAGIAAAALAAWGPARAAARVAPAEAMRTTPSGRGRRTFLERFVAPARRLPARWRMVLRGVGRNRRRTAFTILGVALSLSLVIVVAGLRDTVSEVLDRQFGEIDRSDGQLLAAPDGAATLLTAAREDPAVVEPVARADASLASGDHRYDTLLLGLPVDATLHRFVDTAGHDLHLSDRGGMLLGQGLRRLLDLDVGDQVSITLADGARLTEPVTGFVDEKMTAVAYISLDHLDDSLARSTTTGALVKLRPDSDRDHAAQRLGGLPGAAAYVDNAAVEATMRDAFSLMDVLLAVMLTFAVVMAGALLFNAMSANVAERAVDLGTLHAAGLARKTLARLVATENLLLTLAGIPLGLLAGTYLARWFMASYETEGYRWALRVIQELADQRDMSRSSFVGPVWFGSDGPSGTSAGSGGTLMSISLAKAPPRVRPNESL